MSDVKKQESDVKKQESNVKEQESNVKKQEGMRLAIYLALSFGLTWIWFAVTMPKGETWAEMPQHIKSFVGLGMLFPTISHVLTRRITKEGFAMTGRDSMMLGISFRDRKWIWFLVALILPWIYLEFANVITLIADPGCYDPEYYKVLGVEKKFLALLPVSSMVTGAVGSFAAFGEEEGWRGYMMPKLFALMPKAPALFIGGVIWGLWHAPLTMRGHNFGTGYPGFPWLGIFYMCIFCILIGILLTFLTEMSGSVWPAAILHAVNNAGQAISDGFIDPDKCRRILGMSSGWVGMMGSMLVVAVVVIVLWRRRGDRGQ